MSAKDAAALTGMTRQAWTNYAKAGVISYVRIGRRVLIPRSEVSRLIAEGTRPRTADSLTSVHRKGLSR
jgi:excisionase family DNA binding protein